MSSLVSADDSASSNDEFRQTDAMGELLVFTSQPQDNGSIKHRAYILELVCTKWGEVSHADVKSSSKSCQNKIDWLLRNVWFPR